MKTIFKDGHKGRETGHPSHHAYLEANAAVPYGDYWTKFNVGNAFRFDYESQRATWFSGLPGLWVQDAACQTGLAPIFDRSREKLSSSDAGIAMTRRVLLEALATFEGKGIKPAGVEDPDTFMVRAVSLSLSNNLSWREAGGQHMVARLGAGFGYVP
jgi:hypothetical protein